MVSEKGGAERREGFEQSEISIGRVSGNDLVLAKGNVSKRHARLVFRDSRFIVSDLNSTNGTYVNRRRISQATIVRQGDRIYVGDFVLRIELPEDSGASLAPERASQVPGLAREPMGTAPEISGVSRNPGPEADSGSFPSVPRAPRVPAPSTGELSSPVQSDSVRVQRPPSTREDSIDAEVTAYRSAVRKLVERVADKVEPRALDRDIEEGVAARIGQAIDEQLAALREEDAISAAVVDARLKQDAKAELVGLGAIGGLLEEEDVTEITVAGLHSIAVKRGSRRSLVEPPLSSEASVRRVLARLCRRAGQAPAGDEIVVERQLPEEGFWLRALTGPAVPSGTIIELSRPHRVATTLEDLVRSGTVSRVIATFLRHCVGVRANLLVVGVRDAGTASILSALASASLSGHVVSLEHHDTIACDNPGVSRVSLSNDRVDASRIIQFAASFPGSRLIVENLTGPVASAVVDAVGVGAEGVVAAVPVHGIRRGLARLTADLAARRPGLSGAAAREWVAATFDLVLEVATLRDGRHRVLRLAEVTGVAGEEVATQDLFSFVVERTATGGSIEGTFQPTGVVPRLFDEMVARGVQIDSSLFERAHSR